MKRVAIIGGTGLENFNILTGTKTVKIDTPFGSPSSELITGKFNDIEVVHLARHGREHSIPSSQVNFRANMYALKQLDCTHIFATSVCGSLREEICPGEFIIFDQFIDFTKHRSTTIYEEYQPGEFRYTPMAAPFSFDLRDDLIEASIMLGFTLHTKGTVITIDGPRYSTRAESNLFKQWGADVINMTTAPEIILANELGIPVANISLCTDYDSWRTGAPQISNTEIREMIDTNIPRIIEILKVSLSKV